MKKFLTLVALISFAVGLNAAITQEDIYKTNPNLVNQLKKELTEIENKETEKLKKAYVKDQINKAIKKIFSDKNLLKNAKYAVIRNGQIIKTGTRDEEDGLSFWHRHNPAVENPPEENVCVITEPTWENAALDSQHNTCGWLSYQLSENSPYNDLEHPLSVPEIYLLPDTEDSVIANLYPDVSYDPTLLDLRNLAIHRYYDLSEFPERETPFRNHLIIDDTMAGTVEIYNLFGEDTIYKNTMPLLTTNDWDLFNAYYDTTEYYEEGQQLLTLKSGVYTPVLVTGYLMGENWWDGITVILKWLRVRVDNHYLDGDAVEEHSKKNPANITWNDQEIKIDIDDSINVRNAAYAVYDMSGRLIKRSPVESNHKVINKRDITQTPGIYLFNIRGTNLSLSEKIRF